METILKLVNSLISGCIKPITHTLEDTDMISGQETYILVDTLEAYSSFIIVNIDVEWIDVSVSFWIGNIMVSPCFTTPSTE